MSFVLTAAVIAALLGSASIGGVFFAFSSFVMKALARVAPSAGIAAMQSINVVVINPTFLGTFMGTAALCVLIAVLALGAGGLASAPYLFAGAFSYVAGTFLVTMAGNVPLNNRLAKVSAADPEAASVWEHYLERWTLLNTVRTVAALLAALLFTLGLLQRGI